MRVAILGAGISGLATGRFLAEGGADVHLFEAAEEAGGLCRSAEVDGFTYDLAGGHILYSKDRELLDFEIDCLGGPDAVFPRIRETKILLRGRYVHYPFENGLGDLPPETNAECLAGWIEAFAKRRAGEPSPRNFHDWIHHRMGAGISRHFMVPYNEKLWKCDLREMTSAWVDGRVPDAPLADVVRGAVGLRSEGYTHQRHFYYPKRGGFGAIPRAIGAPVLDRVRLSTPVRELRRLREGWTVNGEGFDLVVNTIPLPELARATPELGAHARRAIDGLRWNGLTSVLIGLERDDLPPYSWIYLPEPEQGPANRITFLSNYSPHNAPPGRGSILAEVTHAGDPPEDPGLVRQVVEGLERAGVLRAKEVVTTAASRVRYAYIVFDLDFETKLACALDGLRRLELPTVGRFGRFEYVNSDQCVLAARALAAEILAGART